MLMSCDDVLESDDVVSSASASSKPDCVFDSRLNFSRYHIRRRKMRHLWPFIPVYVGRRADLVDELRRARVLADWLISIRV